MAITVEDTVLATLTKFGGQATTMQIYEAVTKVKCCVSIGTVYSSVDRLAKKGALTRTKGEARPERGGRAQFIYSITPAGRTAFANATTDIKTIMDMIDFGQFAST